MRPSPRNCVVCGREFTPPKRHEPRYCSKRCIWLALKGPEYNARIGRQNAIKSGDAQRGKGNGKSYRKCMGRHEHRVVAEQILGRPLKKHEVVHHEDGNKLNNDPENLVVTTQAEHMKQHGLGIPGMKLPWKPWAYRGKRSQP
jgi:hypothetical protein